MIEAEQVSLSALQHWQYCPRQCGLIYLEQAFDENIYTLRGRAVHAKVDLPQAQTTKGVRVERALPLWHDELGLVGKSDAVEFLADGAPYPVEYKQGSRSKAPDIAFCDDLQLAGQAMCLQAMTGKAVNEGAIYYASSKRRRVVVITEELRAKVMHVAAAIRRMLAIGELPPPLVAEQAAKRCKACSLLDRCQPQASGAGLLAASAALFDPDA